MRYEKFKFNFEILIYIESFYINVKMQNFEFYVICQKNQPNYNENIIKNIIFDNKYYFDLFIFQLINFHNPL